MPKDIYTDKFLSSYRNQAINLFRLTTGRKLSLDEEEHLDDIIEENFKEKIGDLVNTYQPDKNRDMRVSSLIGWWLGDTPPVLCGSGAMYISEENGGSNITGSFVRMLLDSRKAVKAEMFKATDKEIKDMLDMKQKVFKVLTNAYYGALGQKTFQFHDRNSAAGVTGTGVSVITELIQSFEQFLADNWKFECWGDIFEFIELSNQKMENDQYDICDIEGLEKEDIVEAVGKRLVSKLSYIAVDLPNEIEGKVNNPHAENATRLTDRLCELNLDQLTRLYYRNNLYEFLEESYIMDEVLPEIMKFSIPSGNRSDIEKGDDEDLILAMNMFSELIQEYVCLPVCYEEKMNFCNTRTREAVLLTDTDSTFLLIDQFVEWMKEYFPDYDFEAFENRVTICNILIYVIGDLSQNVLDLWSEKHFVDKEKYPLLNLKNEFLYSRIMITPNKKSYAGSLIAQEGHLFEKPKVDIKGLSIKKTKTNVFTREYFQKVLKDDILNAVKINPYEVLGKFSSYQAKIKDSLMDAEITFTSPLKYSGFDYYKNAWQMEVVRGVLLWNDTYPDDSIKAMDNVNMIKLKAFTPQEFNYILKKYEFDEIEISILENIRELVFQNEKIVHFGFDRICMPKTINKIPKWVLPFINVDEIIMHNSRDALILLESLGLKVVEARGTTKYTNIIKI
jgi:hypothetical protein